MALTRPTSRQADNPASMVERVRDRILSWRDRLLLSPAFHNLVFSTPGLRSIGQRRAQELFDLCAGFVYSQVLYSCVQLEVFERLRHTPQLPDDLAADLNLTPDGAIRLLKAASALRLVQLRAEGKYGLGELGAAFLANPGLREMVLHHKHFYRDLISPVDLLQRADGQGALSGYWGYSQSDHPEDLHSKQVADYSDLMARSLPDVAAQILKAYDVSKHSTLLDIGGGDGSFLRAAASLAPDLDLILFDLPSVTQRAVEAMPLMSQGNAHLRIRSGNFKVDPLPEGADLVTLVRILLDHNDTVVRTLLKAIAKCIAKGGRLLICEPMSSPLTARSADTYFGLYLYAMGGGRTRTHEEMFRLLEEAGFRNSRVLRTDKPLVAQVIVADGPLCTF